MALKSGHVVAAAQNSPSHACPVFDANGELSLMDMQGKTLDTLANGDIVVIKGQRYALGGAPQLFITGGDLVTPGKREQFAFVHIKQIADGA
jgi:hypothetical protein